MATDRDADVPDPYHPRIVADEMFGGEPRIRGRRITVLDIYEQVKEGDGELSPDEFAETFQLAVVDVYAALAYYHAHEERWKTIVRRANRRARTSVSESPEIDRAGSIRTSDEWRDSSTGGPQPVRPTERAALLRESCPASRSGTNS